MCPTTRHGDMRVPGCGTTSETHDGSCSFRMRLEALCGGREGEVVLHHPFDPPARQTVRKVEDRDRARLGQPDRLHGAAGALVPAQDEAAGRLEVGSEHLMAVAGV